MGEMMRIGVIRLIVGAMCCFSCVLYSQARLVPQWSGPSSDSMSALITGLVSYNNEKKSKECASVEFPGLPGSLVLYKSQIEALLHPQQACVSRFLRRSVDNSALQSLTKVNFYALMVVDCANKTSLQDPVYQDPIIWPAGTAMTGPAPMNAPGWNFTPNSKMGYYVVVVQ